MKVFIDANLLIYLNTLRSPEWRRLHEDFYSDLFLEHKAYTDVLVLDELIYVSKKRYNVPYEVTTGFIGSIILPYIEILPLGEKEYEKAAEMLILYDIRPSDALHVAAMTLNGISEIASEDREFESVEGIKRIWLS